MSCSCAIVFAADKAPPNPDLLEFLGGSVQVGKDLVDPISLQAMQQEQTNSQKTTSTRGKSGATDNPAKQGDNHRQSAHE